jgi:ABC-type branched-subunit amino acid transport system ATPase component
VFTKFPVVKDGPHRRGGDLSGGQQQQLAQRGDMDTDNIRNFVAR